ncbi:hypothetical protein POF51_29760 [Brevibacillus sp. AG]|uniref:hypothetical protein n=1 Tax=Brevibacillus sp. AG TaxID=3020891 RepID=UPI002330B53C|nr:hypothetical protein [Brevibacillus sp. AG]MDC0764911.1 hypothetical protein [Brevibacillus sp. AG]
MKIHESNLCIISFQDDLNYQFIDHVEYNSNSEVRKLPNDFNGRIISHDGLNMITCSETRIEVLCCLGLSYLDSIENLVEEILEDFGYNDVSYFSDGKCDCYVESGSAEPIIECHWERTYFLNGKPVRFSFKTEIRQTKLQDTNWLGEQIRAVSGYVQSRFRR